MEFHKAKSVGLRGRSERWLQEEITKDPGLLGLGDLDVRDVERRQPRAGRIDLLLSDPETSTRYVVELQLGSTDESHIIRTIEYWDLEKRRYPQYDHVAVIVAEDITSRFLNVVSLFNGFIPLIAIQIQGLEVNGAFTVVATRILDVMTLGTDEDDEGETVDRGYWEEKASPASVGIVDRAIESLILPIEPDLQAKYNKHYIGLANRGVAKNFLTFIPRKQHVVARFSIPHSDELTGRLDESGLDMLPYEKYWRNYRVRLSARDVDEHQSELQHLAEEAHRSYGR
ncbi:MAG: hypothetical protein F4Z25_01795 [Chloroflexi bacterium]|nr:hypothetical protein [Chloroflexota bacterium]